MVFMGLGNLEMGSIGSCYGKWNMYSGFRAPEVQGPEVWLPEVREPNWLGIELVGDHLSTGTNFGGTICPWGQEVGDRKSGDQDKLRRSPSTTCPPGF